MPVRARVVAAMSGAPEVRAVRRGPYRTDPPPSSPRPCLRRRLPPAPTDGTRLRRVRPGHHTDDAVGRMATVRPQRYGSVPRDGSSEVISPTAERRPGGPVRTRDVDLRDNRFRRFGLPVGHAVAPGWSADGSTLPFQDRNNDRRPCRRRAAPSGLREAHVSPLQRVHLDPGRRRPHVRAEGSHHVTPGATRHPSSRPVHSETTNFAFRGFPRPPVAGRAVAMLAHPQERECRLGAQSCLTTAGCWSMTGSGDLLVVERGRAGAFPASPRR